MCTRSNTAGGSSKPRQPGDSTVGPFVSDPSQAVSDRKMRRSGLFTPKPPVPTVSRANAKSAEHSRGQLKDTLKHKLPKSAQTQKLQPKPAALDLLQLDDRRMRPVKQECQGVKPPLSTSSARQKDYQQAESLAKHAFENGSTATVELPEDDYGNDEFEAYEDDFEPYEDSPKGPEEPQATVDSESVGQPTRMNCMRQISFKLFSQAPMSLAELFGMGCGPAAHLASAVMQTNDDACTLGTQTSKVARVDVAAQVPNDMSFSSPVGVFYSSAAKGTNPYSTNRPLVSSVLGRAEDIQLRHLLASAAHVVEALRPVCMNLDPDSLRDEVGKSPKQALCDGNIDLYLKETLRGRKVQDIACKAGTSLVLCSYTCSQEQQTLYALQGCICVWDIVQPLQPRHVLILEGIPTCVAWAMPVRSKQFNIVLCGTDAGSLCLWEVSEAESLDKTSEQERCPCWPTYTTSHQLKENHEAPICCICSRSASGFKPGILPGDHGQSSQILTLDTLGKIFIWVTKKVSSGERHTNHGLRPGGCVCLFKTAEISTFGPTAEKRNFQLQGATHLSIFPEYAHHLLVGTEDGLCIREAIIGTAEAPRKYFMDTAELNVLAPVICSCFSPFLEGCFLVAYGDGRLALFTASRSLPVRSWVSVCNDKIICVEWSQSVPSVFFVLHSSKVLLQWNLLERSDAPCASQSLKTINMQAFCGRISTLSFSMTRRVSADKKLVQSIPEMAFTVGCEDGHTEVHLLHSVDTGKAADDLVKKICQVYPQLRGKKAKVGG